MSTAVQPPTSGTCPQAYSGPCSSGVTSEVLVIPPPPLLRGSETRSWASQEYLLPGWRDSTWATCRQWAAATCPLEAARSRATAGRCTQAACPRPAMATATLLATACTPMVATPVGTPEGTPATPDLAASLAATPAGTPGAATACHRAVILQAQAASHRGPEGTPRPAATQARSTGAVAAAVAPAAVTATAPAPAGAAAEAAAAAADAAGVAAAAAAAVAATAATSDGEVHRHCSE
mmetsp:Transcript_89119/g.288646  ORF Transcript_89119/g.288646 Transcript_89119/m.288646 type:complete len:236 (+) Transcript_89119:623-1330(+)